MAISKLYRSIGLLYLGRTRWGAAFDAADYFDFQHLTWSKDQLMDDLKAGNLPQGLIVVLPEGEQKVVVFGKQEHHYTLRPLPDMLNELTQAQLEL